MDPFIFKPRSFLKLLWQNKSYIVFLAAFGLFAAIFFFLFKPRAQSYLFIVTALPIMTLFSLVVNTSQAIQKNKILVG